MATPDDIFRNVGIDPASLSHPELPRVRAAFSIVVIAGQWLGTLLMASLGAAMGFALWHLPAPINIPATMAGLLGMSWLIARAIRHDYVWVELEGDTLRAQHLYTGIQIERDIREILELVPVILRPNSIEASLAIAMMGRIKAMHVRFVDGKKPIQICCTDPAMTGARELMEALIFRMTQIAEVETEIMHIDAQPLITKITWKQSH